MTPDEYCEQSAARSHSSFYYTFRLLGAEPRRAITALYAFCREVDDVVDQCREPDIARSKLHWWRQELDNLYQGKPTHPVTRALLPFIERYNLPKAYLEELIDGMEMDLDDTRYHNFQELSLYCYRVAGVVGLLVAEVLGYDNRQTRKYAHKLGIAFQLTNILRDIREDAQRGRIYLPQDEMERFGVQADDLQQGQPSPELRALLAFQAQRAQDYFHQAMELLPEEDRYRQLGGLMMAAIYHKLLDTIIARDYPVLNERVSLPLWQKVWLAWQTARREKRRQRRFLAQGTP